MTPENMKPLLIFCGGICAAKLFAMYRMLGGEYVAFASDVIGPIMFGALQGDALVMCLLACLMMLITTCKIPPVRLVFSIIFIVLLTAYVIDFFCLLLLNNRLILLDLPKFVISLPIISTVVILLMLYVSVALLRPSWKGTQNYEKNNFLIPGSFLLFYLVPFEPELNYMKYDFLTKNIITNNLELTYQIEYDNTTVLAENYIQS